MSNLLKRFFPLDDRVVFTAFGGLLLFTLAAAILKNNYLYLGLPFGVLFLLVILTNYRALYYLLFLSLPFSMERFVAGITTDVLAEPLMIVLSVCLVASFLFGTRPDKAFFSHPVVKLIAAIYLWSLVCAFFSVDALKSVKYLLAKAWYIIPFLLLTGSVVRKVSDIRRVLWCFLVPLVFLVAVVIFKHMLQGFAFHAVQRSVDPFFKNHVIYAATVALFLPFLLTLYKPKQNLLNLFLLAGFLIMLIGIGFSYTRASWLSLPLAVFYYIGIRLKITKLAVIGAYLGGVLALGYFFYENTFMKYAPDYEKTVFYRDNLGKHLQATYKFEDVSGMERVYRWVAAVKMGVDRPLFGSGPSTFYPEYKKYTVTSFQTYVSDNPEKSTTHNYFLLTLAEQGIIGLLLFLALVGYVLVLVQKLFHRTRNPEFRRAILGAGLCFFIIIFHLV
ncbi:MAG TPA: O-antigen ligase family protein, partial [Adhaeribacter sp.]|nr:O-antigen ligase family protein [Adhaeribacter sp.]